MELYFNTIRQKGGWNNNPNCRQFTAAYKKSLVTKIESSRSGNVVALDNTDVPNLCDTARATANDISGTSLEATLEEEIDDCVFILTEETSNIFRENIVHYVAGFVVTKLRKQLKCQTCLTALDERCHPLGSHNYSRVDTKTLLLIKDNGGLCYPSPSVVKLCSLTENVIRQLGTIKGSAKNIHLKIECLVLRQLITRDIFPTLTQHMFDDELGCQHHLNVLTKKIIKIYLNIRLRKISKDINDQMKKDAVRKKLTKLILFQGQ